MYLVVNLAVGGDSGPADRAHTVASELAIDSGSAMRSGAAGAAAPAGRSGARRGCERSAPLYRNGYALVASSGLTSALGLVFWVLAARLYAAGGGRRQRRR